MINVKLNPKNKTKIKQKTIDILTQDGRSNSLDNFYQVPRKYGDFLEECCRIRSGNKFIPFMPFDYQKVVSDLIDDYRGIMIFKTRQLGLTECISAKFLHKALLNPAYASAVLSLGQKESSNIAVRIQSMPANVKDLKFLTKSKTEIHFQNAGKIWFRPATDNATRSLESVSDIFYDEAAFPPNFSEIYASSTPSQEAVGENARTIMATTMSQLGKLSTFWQMFNSANPVDAESIIQRIKLGKEEPCYWWIDDNGWAKVIIHWKAHPVYSSVPDFLEKTKKKHKLTDDALNREYNLGIPDSGGALFSYEYVSKCAVGSWQLPNKDRYYMAALDPNFGGTDYWEYLIIDITETPYQVVAEYRENSRQSLYCIDKTLELSDAYNPVLTVIEHNSGGAIIAAEISKLRRNLSIETVATTNVSKVQNTDRLALALEKQEVIFPYNWDGLTEFGAFSLQSRKAMYGHDDCVMCLAIAFAKLDVALRRKGTALEGDLGTIAGRKSRFR
jgi:hypothetical protein